NDNGTSQSYQMAYQDYKQIAVVKDLTTYTDSDVTEDTYYGYRIEVSKNGQTATSSEASIFHYRLNDFKAENVSEGIKLNWSASHSSELQIYRKTPDSDYELLDTLNWWIETYTDDSANSGITYTYKIVGPYKEYTAEDVLSITRLSNPVFKSAANTMDGIKLTWNEVAGANGYNIYRVNSDDSLTRIGSVSEETFFVDTNVVSGTSYTYAVKAYKGKSSSEYNTISKCFLTGVTAKAFNNKTGMSVTWNKVPGVTGYYIYRKPQSGGYSLEKIATAAASATSYLDTEPLVGGRAYTYVVRAYRGNVLSGYQPSSMRALGVPTLTLSSSSGKVQLKWTKVSGAKGYYIYRKTGNGSFEKIGSVTGVGTLRYTDTTAAKKKTYSYAVRAYNGGAMSTFIDKKITVK
ncbi:MAG: hypothetical protein Q4B26_08155, partial [Eubacteriales bacterium]|nr:hypothetical protein [Eubacteriales bacterium]